MESPSTCLRCHKPLSLPSGGQLCPTCLVVVDTPPGTNILSPAQSGWPGRDDTVRHGTIPTHGHLPTAPPGYDLIRRVGCGGMGDVYLARDLATEREVAMKFLWSPSDPAAHDRFLVEVRALAKVDHPNIVRVLAADVHRREPFFTMEYADGGSLGRWVEKNGPLPPADAARVARDIARALAVAHAAGVIHRDVKPSNVLLTGVAAVPPAQPVPRLGNGRGVGGQQSGAFDLTPRLSDFGLAKRLDRDDGLSATTGGMGTPGYMPPEQVSGKHGDLGPASDVYGLGATLFYLLAGRAPFRGGSPVEVTAKVLAGPAPRLRAVAPTAPPELEAVVARCLERNAADRYPTASALADDLDRVLDGRAPLAPLLSWRRRAYLGVVRNRKRVGVGLAAVVALVAVFVVGVVAARPKAEDPFADARKLLAAGMPATLIGETGRPKYVRAAFGNAVIGDSVTGDGTCTITSLGDAATELAPDSGCDRYRLSAELRQLNTPDPNSPEIDRVGVYFGHTTVAVDGKPIHLMDSVRFNDIPAWADPPDVKRSVYLGLFGLIQQEPRPHNLRGGSRPFPLTGSQANGRWRKVVVEVTPEGVLVKWRDDAGELVKGIELPVKKCRSTWEAARRFMDERVPGSGPILREWHPRGAIGVLSFRASVAVRNVILEPLPPPQ